MNTRILPRKRLLSPSFIINLFILIPMYWRKRKRTELESEKRHGIDLLFLTTGVRSGGFQLLVCRSIFFLIRALTSQLPLSILHYNYLTTLYFLSFTHSLVLSRCEGKNVEIVAELLINGNAFSGYTDDDGSSGISLANPLILTHSYLPPCFIIT